jgi:hypothetical protein
MPIKLFTDGEVLTAASVNTYFMDQALCVFDDATARDAAFGGVGEPILQEGRICYLKSDDTIYIYTGSAWTAQLATIANSAITTAKLDGTSGSEAVTTAKIRTGAVTSDKIADGTIVNGDISASAAIALSKLATGALPTDITVASANLVDLTIDTVDIKNNAVTSAKLGTDLSLSGSTKIEEIFEKASIIAAQPVASNGATLTLTITDGAVYYYTVSTTRNIALDIVTTGMADGSAVTVLVAVTSSSTAGKITDINVNGANPFAVKWFGGNAYPNGSGSDAVDAYTVTVFRSGSDYTVFASQSKFA